MIHIEPKLLVVRGGKDFKEYGDPYDFCLSIFVDGDSARIFALHGKFNFKDFADIKKQLLSMGITKAHWERIKNKLKKEVTCTGER